MKATTNMKWLMRKLDDYPRVKFFIVDRIAGIYFYFKKAEK